MGRLGAHMSVAGGVDTAFERGVRVGCEAMQLFTKNSNQWVGRPLAPGEVARFCEAAGRTLIHPLLAHSSYLINLGSPCADLLKRSRAALFDELERAAALGLDYLVIHPGAATGGNEEDCLKRIAESLSELNHRMPRAPTRILLENTAGQGSSVGHRLEHLAQILGLIEPAGFVGVCLDTCHLFAAGYDLRTRAAYDKTMREVATLVGLDRVKAFHLNDCQKDLGCRVDRHEHVGRGFIGREGFRLLVRDPRFAQHPMILETPKGDDGFSMDIVNLRLLRRLAASGGPRASRFRPQSPPR
jgi:deoxyribonuclease-4